MKGSLAWRMSLVALALILGVLFAMPSVLTEDSYLRRTLPNLNLGLDLQGGIHLILGIDVDKATEFRVGRLGQNLVNMARDERLAVKSATANGLGLEVVLVKEEHLEPLLELLQEDFSSFNVVGEPRMDGDNVVLSLAYDTEQAEALKESAFLQAEETLRNRVDEFGLTEPDIRRMEDYKIQIQLPGMHDTDRAVANIQRVALLEFMLTAENQDIASAEQGLLEPGTELFYRKAEGETQGAPVILETTVFLTGDYIDNAYVGFGQMNEPYVYLDFNSEGRVIFADLTEEYTNRQLAIVLDGVVYSDPVIRERIAGGSAQISGDFTEQEAHDLARVLRSGSLPAPVTVEGQSRVGPSLGQESIDKGIKAAIFGLAAVLVFMVVYYGLSGLIADFALMFNLVLIMAFLSIMEGTLTLPGIAGIILTIGMAVDANVLIFERIREELRKGLTPRAAVDEGYAKASLTILDANVTTVIAALILLQFGTGPVKGFAVTLTLGILSSMFTAIFVSRVFMDIWISIRKTAKLSI
ncbi:MAG: protein translocase subunit SecD [Desulfovibrio sp.]|nr:MAG: protein translocase subunit SecD [Desulfovibrio sp.]